MNRAEQQRNLWERSGMYIYIYIYTAELGPCFLFALRLPSVCSAFTLPTLLRPCRLPPGNDSLLKKNLQMNSQQRLSNARSVFLTASVVLHGTL